MTKTQKGFTLIELLVVIAIIGILAGILFVAINPQEQTNKAEDAKKQTAVAQVNTQSAIFLSDNGNYGGVCNNPKIGQLTASTGGTCTDESGAFAFVVTLNNAGKNADGEQEAIKTYCTDSTGFTGYGTVDSGATKCTPNP